MHQPVKWILLWSLDMAAPPLVLAAETTKKTDDDVLVAFSVHGLGGGSSLRSSEGAGEGAREARRGWLSSLNTVVGDRQDTML